MMNAAVIKPNNLVSKPRVLCVDDEPAVLEGLALHLRRHYEVVLASSAEQALRILASEPPFAVVMSDMRMPGMDGAALLSRVRELDPLAVRLLLTGLADMKAAASAVNDGQVFRFLTKPCAPERLQEALDGAVVQHRQLRAERELLELTLRGAVQALTEVLALMDPEAYGAASRIQRIALGVAERVGVSTLWPIELAAILMPIGRVSLPPDVIKRSRYGDPLTTEEEAMLERVPEVTDRLLASIPRLEIVRNILRYATRHNGRTMEATGTPEQILTVRSARVLRLAMDCEALEGRGQDAALAVAELRGRGTHEPQLIAALQLVKGGIEEIEVRELPIRALKPGMVFAEDLCTMGGQLLAARGYEVTAGFVERARNFRPGVMREPIKVILPREHA